MIRKHQSSVNERDVNCNQESEFSPESVDYETSLLQLEFVKSALTVNPCMVYFYKILHLLQFYLCIHIQEPSELFIFTRRR